VGTWASGVQIVPEVAAQVESLTVFQRSAPWVLPKAGRRIPAGVQRLFRVAPPLLRAYRGALYWARELMGVPMMSGNRLALWRGERRGRRHMSRHIADPQLRRKLTPDYRIGCKRVLLSDAYYPALARDNVEVVTDGIAKVLPNSVVDGAGAERDVDVIIFATGFQGALQRVRILGAGGRSLWRDWVRDGAVSLRGITVAGYPNLFLLHGPNSGSAHKGSPTQACAA
jgi:cation diffusion facilitator CzcD-associated flavoprotein CzcO